MFSFTDIDLSITANTGSDRGELRSSITNTIRVIDDKFIIIRTEINSFEAVPTTILIQLHRKRLFHTSANLHRRSGVHIPINRRQRIASKTKPTVSRTPASIRIVDHAMLSGRTNNPTIETAVAGANSSGLTRTSADSRHFIDRIAIERITNLIAKYRPCRPSTHGLAREIGAITHRRVAPIRGVISIQNY